MRFCSLATGGCTGFDGEQSGSGVACRVSTRNTGRYNCER
jgi:hypothetical protein